MSEIEERIKKELGDVKIDKHLSVTYEHLSENQKQGFWAFLTEIKTGQIKPFFKGNSLIFRKPFGSNARLLVIKLKEGAFSEIFLGNHKYYDIFRKMWEL